MAQGLAGQDDHTDQASIQFYSKHAAELREVLDQHISFEMFENAAQMEALHPSLNDLLVDLITVGGFYEERFPGSHAPKKARYVETRPDVFTLQPVGADKRKARAA